MKSELPSREALEALILEVLTEIGPLSSAELTRRIAERLQGVPEEVEVPVRAALMALLQSAAVERHEFDVEVIWTIKAEPRPSEQISAPIDDGPARQQQSQQQQQQRSELEPDDAVFELMRTRPGEPRHEFMVEAEPAAQPLEEHLLHDPRSVPVWYGTNRKPASVDAEREGYGGQTDDRMHYGYCMVNVPKRYVRGGSGRGWLGRLIHGEKTQLELGSITPLPEADFWPRLAATLAAQADSNAMLLFVHGFRTTFRDAAESAAQLSYELDLPAAFFSWASRGKLARYPADEEAAREAVGPLQQFVRSLVGTLAPQQRTLHVVAHSMGNRALLQALHEVALQGVAAGFKLGQVIFAAPDVPQREFLRQLGKVVATPGLTAGQTLYAAKDDLALFTSQELHDNPRAGICPPITVAPHLETVDVSIYNLSVLGHGYCFNVGPVLEDMAVVLHGGCFRLRTKAADGHWVLG